MDSSQRFRARIILFLIATSAAGLVLSLYWIQIIKGESYTARADQQYEKPNHTLFDRGSIYFSSKDGTKVSAATINRGYIVYIDPTKVTDPLGTYEAIHQYLKIDKDKFLNQAKKINDRYEELSDRVSEEDAIAIAELSLPGVAITKHNWRSYPGGELSSHVLGLIGENKDGTVAGRYGLERTYENTLKRNPTASNSNVFTQIFAGIRDTVFGEGDNKPGEIITTIEPTVEGHIEAILKKTEVEWHPDRIGAIVMDPKTGEIISMASLPTFNPEDLSHISDVSVLSNPLVEYVYEMGSIMKPLTMAIGLDSGVITPDSTYNDTGTLQLDDKKISNYDGKARGITPMQQILSQSLNVGVATIALKVGSKKFTEYFTSLGFKEKTGIDEPNESTGLLDNLDSALDIEIATAAFGQGLAVTPIAIIRALGSLANEGRMVKPHLVREIDYIDGSNTKTKIETTSPIFNKKSVEDTTSMLIKVVDEALKGGKIKMDHYSIAAKTGTAQIPNPNGGGYYTNRYLHSFFGYFPAYNPKFIVFLYQINPKGAQFASETLTTPFEEITKFLITYYNIAPDR